MADDLVWLVMGTTGAGEFVSEIVEIDGGQSRVAYASPVRWMLCRRENTKFALNLRPMVAEPFEAVARRATEALAGKGETTL